ncbi:NAD-dependent epimerase/dehydratase family protein [Muriicola sp. Z0-33]|uniref:NAD-dependent epimerase/dehydratase family protein n=1 Tax=Muriicola sp. Z0-33 TaxID=2816957 RepID=UPI0022384C61|nr:NAD-dependent epimerase/dehydratase family protein [Muriicola sp. Z0-33]MCW5515663.1 NAD-dependent epimerase/dehydratase family protein [Muriicola sp. Z0-33]
MNIALITGSSGLIGSEACKFWDKKGFSVIGIDNDMRSYFFGADASTLNMESKLKSSLNNFTSHSIDIRDYDKLKLLFSKFKTQIKVIIHTAAQPSHDWAAKEPFTDFSINATGTLNMLELTRKYCPEAAFIFTSTNKVYGDTPNSLPMTELEHRWEISEDHPFHEHGIDESMSVDQSKHSLFGASKLSADILVQEYGRYFGMNTVAFRGGCLTGPSHKGAELHGFLSYLIRCAMEGKHYTIFGYKGKQVRDNIHSSDLIKAFWHYYQNPRKGEVYNIGGSRNSNISILEAIQKIEEFSGKKIQYTVSDEARSGDHIWYISDIRKFKDHYPEFEYDYDMDRILKEMLNAVSE